MSDTPNFLRVSTPGRVCLFGEHQDYLQLPVIPCAISLRIALEGRRRHDLLVHLALPDVNAEISFSLADPLSYQDKRDYFRSALNVLRRAGFTFAAGFDCTVHGEIPINAGTSSSSALVVTWVNFLAQMSDQQQQLSPEECARYAHAAEVLEFHEPGGMMDHYATACGGVLALRFNPTLQIEKLSPSLQPLVLGDSGEPKDTKSILAWVKNQVLDIVAQLSERYPDFSLHTVALEELDRYTANLNHSESTLLWGTLRNRDLTQEALELLRQPEIDDLMLGELLTEHQAVLRDILKISTPKVDRMITAALRAGAYGGKINGSGGGGCMFAYAPKNPEAVAQAIEAVGGKACIVHVDSGTRHECL
ncbi:GHMP kinase [candidate division KSB1 bacterium]|nr:GHMP kinase [candidate division KSB1 bacterium]